MMPMKPLKEKVSITLDEDLVTRIRELAEQDDRSFSQYINKVLKEHAAKYPPKSPSSLPR
ncbi:MAG: ribbon-helix-helix protein, CopG family [Clostridia bacterium]|nr:ribbon-helix-helix protein, CopG family [Clostridia bacterium]